MSFDRIIRARLVRAIESRGYTLTGLSVAMGRSKGHLGRKLKVQTDDDRHGRPVLLPDADEILKAIGAEPKDILGPPGPDDE